MNWLAHAFLSEDNTHFRLGNLAGDLFKGNLWQNLPADTIRGIQTHRAIDLFTDAHPVVRRSKQRLGTRGLLRGVAIDITYDHFLAKNWDTYSKTPLVPFLRRFHEQTQPLLPLYPPRVRKFLSAIVHPDRLARYLDFDSIGTSLRSIDSRLSRRVLRRETASAHSPRIAETLPALEQDFHAFFPELLNHTRARFRHHPGTA